LQPDVLPEYTVQVNWPYYVSDCNHN